MLARQIRFTCPHCGTVNRAPVRSIGRGGSCVRCGGGIKVPSAHSVAGAIDEVDTHDHDEVSENVVPADLIGTGFERAIDDSASDETSVRLFDLGRPASPTRSVKAPSAIVAEATILPTASQLASSDRADRSTVPPVQTLRSLRRFVSQARPRRHVAARRQQPGTPWWAWLAQGALSIGAVYVLAAVYNGSFNTQVNAVTTPRFVSTADDNEAGTDETASDDVAGLIAPVEIENRQSDSIALDQTALAELLSRSTPDERIWIRYERILTSSPRPLYAIVRVTQSRDGRVRIDRNETSERPTEFPDDAPVVNRRPTSRPAGGSTDLEAQ